MHVGVNLTLMRFQTKVYDHTVTVLMAILIAHFDSELRRFDQGIRRPEFILG